MSVGMTILVGALTIFITVLAVFSAYSMILAAFHVTGNSIERHHSDISFPEEVGYMLWIIILFALVSYGVGTLVTAL